MMKKREDQLRSQGSREKWFSYRAVSPASIVKILKQKNLWHNSFLCKWSCLILLS